MQAQALCEWFTSRKAWCTVCRRAPFCLRGSYICNVRSPMSHPKADFETIEGFTPPMNKSHGLSKQKRKTTGEQKMGSSTGYEPRRPETCFGPKYTPPYRTVEAWFSGRAVYMSSVASSPVQASLVSTGYLQGRIMFWAQIYSALPHCRGTVQRTSGLHESGCFVSSAGLPCKHGVFSRQTTPAIASRDALRQSHRKCGMYTF